MQTGCLWIIIARRLEKKEKVQGCTFFLTEREDIYAAGYDSRKSGEGDHPVYHSDFYRKCISAVLQYGRHDHCRKICRNKGTGSSGKCGNDYVSDHRFYAWSDSRVYGADSTAVWSRGYEGDAKNSGKCRPVISDHERNYDSCEYGRNEGLVKIYEYTGRYFCRCLSLYYDYLCRNFCNGTL